MLKLLDSYKLANNFIYIKVRPGTNLVLSIFNPFIKPFPSFGLKVNKLDFKKIISTGDNLDLVTLKAFRRIDKLLYKKQTSLTEVHFNLLINNFGLSNYLHNNSSTIYKRTLNFQILTGRFLLLRGVKSFNCSIKISTGFVTSLFYLFNSTLLQRVVILV
jgi:hypothetical protein